MSDEILRDKLRRLRREPVGPAPVPARERLQRRAARTGANAPALPAPGTSDPVCTRSTRFEPDHRHGDWRLSEIAGADARAFALLTGDPALADLDLARALYLDTETSGLAGGAGTWVFLVGLGSFESGRFEVWQGFLADPRDERELLAEAAERIRAAPAVVSFFGKAFDRHRLEDKMRLHGIEPPFTGRPHLDLYHPLRRLYRAAMEDSRLRSFERGLCGVERDDDLPGSLAPAAWFDFLSGRPHRLDGVFRHNLDDVLSLVTLAAHLARTLAETRADGSPLSGCAAARSHAVARSFFLERAGAESLAWIEKALARGGSAAAPALLELQARALRRIERAQRVGAAPATRCPADSRASRAASKRSAGTSSQSVS